MELTYTPQQNAFRAEVRAWLAEHAPREPLASYDTREGFATPTSCTKRRWTTLPPTAT